MDKKRKSTYILICLLLAGALVVLFLMRGWETADYTMGYGPAFYPKVLIVALFILLVGLFLTEGLPKKPREEQAASENGDGADCADSANERLFDLQRLKFPALFAGMLILYILLWNVLGFVADTILFSFGGMMSLKGKPWISAVISVCFALVIYFVFSKLLYVNLPVGMVWGG